MWSYLKGSQEGYGSSSSALPNPQRASPMENGQQGIQPSIPLGRTWSKLPEDMSQIDRLQRPYGNHTRMKSHQEAKPALQQLQTIQEPTDQWPRVTIPHKPRWFPGEDKDTREKQDLFQPKAEIVRPNNPEAVGLGGRSAQKQEIVSNTSRISSPTNINITPTQTEHNVATPESNLNSDKLLLQRSQFSVQTQ
ncbi:hypothetical protein O181_038192 [Austropuccinia psidii MF-1]|uniref:Uncharacterized protein n=1 Tax=Austropuccinia psidii MF-1 TaxID=1389203 RepID=A0A9Q3HBN6_9BASI|nr:hypothetical protein [Austropuccinia psidii MF-1]